MFARTNKLVSAALSAVFLMTSALTSMAVLDKGEIVSADTKVYDTGCITYYDIDKKEDGSNGTPTPTYGETREMAIFRYINANGELTTVENDGYNTYTTTVSKGDSIDLFITFEMENTTGAYMKYSLRYSAMGGYIWGNKITAFVSKYESYESYWQAPMSKDYNPAVPLEFELTQSDFPDDVNSDISELITARLNQFFYRAELLLNEHGFSWTDFGFYSSDFLEMIGAEPTATPTLTPTTEPTEEPEPTVEATPTDVPSVPLDQVTAFAERLYTCALDRECDEDGRDYWAEVLRSGASAAEAAHEFLFSQEVEDANISNIEFVRRLYKTFMGRDCVDDEIEYWIGVMALGETRESIFAGFVDSEEWVNLCYLAGINSGSSTLPTVDKPATQAVIDFATRLYTTCLGREGEQEGIDYWANQLTNGRASGTEAARTFFFCDEFIDGDHSDIEFVTRLYRTFMGRDASSEEIDFWVTNVDAYGREAVFSGFATSDEFAELCNDAGINP